MIDYDKIVNGAVASIKPSGIRKFFDIVSEMPDAISLGVGEPDFVTPWSIRDYAIKSIQKGYTQYTSNKGLAELRREISGYLSSRFALQYDSSNEILITVGASEAIDLALRTIVCYGDEVLVPQPSYVSYEPNVNIVGGVAVPICTTMEHGFAITPQLLEDAITDKTKAIIFPYPNNPTGATMDKEQMNKILDIIIKHNLIVISDEIYAELTYGAQHVSIASLKGMWERTIVISGFSKAFAMTGWRLGYLCAPHQLVMQMTKVHQYTIMCAPTCSQFAGYNALVTGRQDGYEEVGQMREEYNRRRRFMIDAFRKMGLECFEPKGAFYVFPSIKNLGMTGEEFANSLLESQQVAVVPGNAFGECGTYHVRCCYATSMKNLTIAMDRIAKFVKSCLKAKSNSS